MIENVSAINFDGFGEVKDEQPQVFKKDGTPYDMNDPEFPIVRDHQFKVKYWQMPRMDSYHLRYMDEHWVYFNKTRFHGELKKPELALLRDTDALKMKLRGLWEPRKRKLSLSPNLFNAPHEGWANRVLIHEMAHQYVTEHHGWEKEIEDGKKTKGHGPLWQAAMRMAGLAPNRYDYEGNETYMDMHEKKKHKQEIERRDRRSDTFRQLAERGVPQPNPLPGERIRFIDDNANELIGIFLKMEKRKGKMLHRVRVMKGNEQWSYWLSPNQMFKPEDA